MKRAKVWLPPIALTLAALALPAVARADFVCPACGAETLVVAQLVDLVLTTVLQKGVAVLLLGATAIVSLPWIVAGIAVVAIYLPRWLHIMR